nr:hypothetical protein GCM10025730_15410 [Promicromonospora thailandica]
MDGEGACPELVDQGGATLLVEAGDHDVRALRVEGAHVAGALAAGAAGHEHGLVVEAGHGVLLRCRGL